ncbi:MAG: DUF5719 family protein [Acidimicrobiales bacterium]
MSWWRKGRSEDEPADDNQDPATPGEGFGDAYRDPSFLDEGHPPDGYPETHNRGHDYPDAGAQFAASDYAESGFGDPAGPIGGGSADLGFPDDDAVRPLDPGATGPIPAPNHAADRPVSSRPTLPPEAPWADDRLDGGDPGDDPFAAAEPVDLGIPGPPTDLGEEPEALEPETGDGAAGRGRRLRRPRRPQGSERPSGRRGAGAIRASLVFVVAGILLAAGLYDRVEPTTADEADTGAAPVVTPSMTDPARLDGVWYCALGSSAPDGFANNTLTLSNLGDEPTKASIGVLTGDGRAPTITVDLAPHSTQEIPLSDAARAEVAGAVVEMLDGVGVVSHRVDTAVGPAEAPCATHVSNTWYFAGGRTERDAKEYLALMNPFPEDVVFNVELYRASGRPRQPAELRGADVKANSIKVIEIDTYIAREEVVAVTVNTVRGRLVAERLVTTNGDLGPKGAALELGAPEPALSWMLPAGRVQATGDDQVIVFNPDPERSASVELDLWPLNPTDRSLYGMSSIPRELLPGRFEVIDLRNEAQRFGVPLPYEMGVSVRSTNEVPIVTERWQFATAVDRSLIGAGGSEADPEDPTTDPTAPDGTTDTTAPDGTTDTTAAETAPGTGDAGQPDTGELDIPGILGGEAQELVQPSPDVGIATSRGTEVLSSRWVVPWVPVAAPSASVIVVTAPQDASIEVRALVNGEMAGPFLADVAAGGRAIVPLDIAGPGAAVLVESTGPVSVEAQVVNPGVSYDVIAGVPTVAG